MKNLLIAPILITSALFSSFAAAEFHTVTLGYAQSEVQHYDDINGASVKYRYESDGSQLGLITSFNWMKGESRHVRLKYYSLMAGPAWRVNKVFSLYTTAGLSWNRMKYDYYGSDSDKSFAYGVGVQLNPEENIALEIGYQGGKIFHATTHGFNIGIGYRF